MGQVSVALSAPVRGIGASCVHHGTIQDGPNYIPFSDVRPPDLSLVDSAAITDNGARISFDGLACKPLDGATAPVILPVVPLVRHPACVGNQVVRVVRN